MNDFILIFMAGYFFRSFMYDMDETNSRYLKYGMNEFFYLSLIKECLDATIISCCLFELRCDLFEVGFVMFPIMFSIEYIASKFLFPFVRKKLKKGRTEDADNN